MLKQRVITALILAAVFFTALFALPTVWFAGICLVALMTGVYEWGKLAGLKPAACLAVAAAVALIGLLLLLAGSVGASRLAPGPLPLALFGAASAFWIVVAPLWLYRGWTTRSTAGVTLLGVLAVFAMWMAMVELHARSPWLLLGVMMVVWIADTAAYFSGRKFGRRKLAPTISPGKSWEGVYGGLACVFVYAVLVMLFSPLAADPELSRPLVAASALLLAMVSVVGDLFESWMKRQAGVKDSGTSLPGHGGVLDRIDALIPALPVATLLVLLLS